MWRIKKVVKNTKSNKLNSKMNNLEKKIPDAATSIQINQYNKDKKICRKKMMIAVESTRH